MTDHPRRITRALLSVSDKTGLVDFARALAGHGVELISTGGTKSALADAGLKVLDVSEVTGLPEMMDGRVKTLHPKVHGGLLAIRDNATHAAAMAAHGIRPIDLLVVNLYPFEATVAKGADDDTCVENIDIQIKRVLDPLNILIRARWPWMRLEDRRDPGEGGLCRPGYGVDAVCPVWSVSIRLPGFFGERGGKRFPSGTGRPGQGAPGGEDRTK